MLQRLGENPKKQRIGFLCHAERNALRDIFIRLIAEIPESVHRAVVIRLEIVEIRAVRFSAGNGVHALAESQIFDALEVRIDLTDPACQISALDNGHRFRFRSPFLADTQNRTGNIRLRHQQVVAVCPNIIIAHRHDGIRCDAADAGIDVLRRGRKHIVKTNPGVRADCAQNIRCDSCGSALLFIFKRRPVLLVKDIYDRLFRQVVHLLLRITHSLRGGSTKVIFE